LIVFFAAHLLVAVRHRRGYLPLVIGLSDLSEGASINSLNFSTMFFFGIATPL
jgi:hypothetical protein